MLACNDPHQIPAKQAYFISDGSPIDNFDFFKPICVARGFIFFKFVLYFKFVYIG
jgi:hypothetical protein